MTLTKLINAQERIFVKAALEGNIPVVMKALDAGVDINVVSTDIVVISVSCFFEVFKILTSLWMLIASAGCNRVDVRMWSWS